jgi:capsular exopolysaccharide synthesis family protein
VVSEGAAGDEIGREVGFLWSPSAEDLAQVESVDFTVSPPAEAAAGISMDLLTTMSGAGNFINIRYPSTDPERAARILNGVLARFQTVAQSLKEIELESNLVSLVDQLAQAEDSLNRVTEALEAFRLSTITQPGERATQTPGGIAVMQNPLREEFFQLQSEQQTLERQISELESIVAVVNNGGEVPIPRIQAVERAGQSIELNAMLTRLTEMRGELRDLRLRYTDQHPRVVALRDDIRTLEQGSIPVLIAGVQDALEGELSRVEGRMSRASSQMGAVPITLMREQQLEREQERFAELVTTLQNRRTLAELQFQGSLADFEILSEATVPFTPSSDQRLPMAAIVLAGFMGLGLLGAILLDRTDTRFRYPEDVTSGIGVDVLGMIPRVGRSGSEAEVEEAFRDLRMRLMYAHGSAGPVMVVFSSPGPGEGKTLITANLALAFAKIGRKTLVIDADTRRGDLHRLLGEERGAGLVDYLAGGSDGKIIHRTEYPNLFFMGAGARLSRAPELLAGERVRHLFYKLRERYDVILVDAPPLGAGADAFHLATLTGSMALVLRAGESEKAVVEKKLQALAHLPVRVLGGILNDVSSTALKGYGYYSYYMPGYEAAGEDDAVAEYVPALGAGDMPEIGERDE